MPGTDIDVPTDVFATTQHPTDFFDPPYPEDRTMPGHAAEVLPQLFTRILHPTDFSENSRYAFQTACALARENHATLLVLHVVAPNVSPLAQAGDLVWNKDGTVHVPDPRQPAESRESLARLPWPRPSDSRSRVEYRLAEGDPAEEVLRLAERLRCDLIVMGTHGKTGLGRLLTGSVAEGVLRGAACPVLVVKHNESAARERNWALERLAADVTNTAYAIALQHGARGSWIDLELGLWKALAGIVREWGRQVAAK